MTPSGTSSRASGDDGDYEHEIHDKIGDHHVLIVLTHPVILLKVFM
jgi:hypothetical protein